MKGVVCFVDISQVPLPVFVFVPPAGSCKLNNKAKQNLLFGPSSNLSHTTPITKVKAEAGEEGIATATASEIRVCVNRTCRRQGSMETLEILSGIAPPHVSVKSCGCLGRCGAGPNLVVLPQATFVTHCGTAARAANTMLNLCGGDPGSWSNSLEALALRKRADNELRKGNNTNIDYEEALLLLSQAINLKPCGGIHVLYKDRSAVRLVMGSMVEALEDAKEALAIAPKYPEAYISQGDALMAMDQFDAAEKSYAMAVELDPSIYRSKSFKHISSKECFTQNP